MADVADEKRPPTGLDAIKTAPAQLRDVLAELYPYREDAARAAGDAGLNLGRIALDGSAQQIWHSIIYEARCSRRLEALASVAIVDYPDNDALRAAVDSVRHWAPLSEVDARIRGERAFDIVARRMLAVVDRLDLRNTKTEKAQKYFASIGACIGALAEGPHDEISIARRCSELRAHVASFETAVAGIIPNAEAIELQRQLRGAAIDRAILVAAYQAGDGDIEVAKRLAETAGRFDELAVRIGLTGT
jgi:hypothetical protein